MANYREYSINKTLSKDMINKKVSGVCAGIAKHYEVPRLAVRIASLVALITFPVLTLVAYGVAAMLMPTRKYS